MPDPSPSDDELECRRSTISDELEVPEEPPDPETTDHVLPDDDLVYPTFTFDSGAIDEGGTFDLEQACDRETMRDWLEALAGGMASHDVGVETPEEMAIFGVGASGVSMAFETEPEAEQTGTLEVTFSLPAKVVAFSDDPTDRRAGARGGSGFVPLAMLESDRDPSSFRCYNWIDDPFEGE